MQLRLLVHEPADAAWNMAVDEALLTAGNEPTLRLYGWQPHAVSVGYFQRFADFGDLPAGTPIVRRLTGGGAIHHGEEITFSLTVDAALLPRNVAASYRLLHDAAVQSLAEGGIRCHRLDRGPPPSARPTDRWCFAASGRDDVVTDAGKLLGSAQRRVQHPHARVLHHGSIVLRRPTLTPFVAAADDVASLDVGFVTQLRQLLAEHICRALGMVLRRGELTAAERSLAAHLSRDRYGDGAFVRQR